MFHLRWTSLPSVPTSALPSPLPLSLSLSLPFFFLFISRCHLPVIPPSLRQTGVSLDWYSSTPPFASGTFPFLHLLLFFFKSVPPSFTLLHPQCPSSLSPSPYIPFKRPQLIYCVKSINCTQDFVLETHTCITLHWRTLACIWIVYWSSVYSRCHLGNSLASCFPLPPASLYCASTWHLWSFLVNRYSTLVHFSPNTHCVCPWGLTDFYDIL